LPFQQFDDAIFVAGVQRRLQFLRGGRCDRTFFANDRGDVVVSAFDRDGEGLVASPVGYIPV